MRDLEIRGAGNLLGAQQHGDMDSVGYDMYCKLLQEAVDDIRGVKHSNVVCQVDALIDAYLSPDYVSDENSRMKILRDILDINVQSDVEKLSKKLKESFGDVPTPLVNLMNISLAKNLAQDMFIEHIQINNLTCEITFVDADFTKSEKIMAAIFNKKYNASLVNDVRPKVKFNFKTNSNVEKLMMLIEFFNEASL